MPELPEVESSRLTLAQLAGEAITKVQLLEDKLVFGDSQMLLDEALNGAKFGKPIRKGKNLAVEIKNKKQGEKKYLLIHFGMTGCLVIRGKSSMQYKAFKVDDASWPPRFWKLVITMANGTELAYCDQRRIGRIKLQSGSPLDIASPLSHLAPDPLVDGVPDIATLTGKMATVSGSIKCLLLDQSGIVCGLGNWMVDEILYSAMIHPETRACDINERGLESLKLAIEYVVKEAVNAIKDSVDYPSSWIFHKHWDQGKKGASSETSKGEKLCVIKVGGRTTLYVPSVQKLSGPFVEKKNKEKGGGGDGKERKLSKKHKLKEAAEKEEGTSKRKKR